jgi:hypothetical protein
MEKSSKRGKIPQSDWPLIMTRYEAGETLASIARTYDCSPPAISYVVSRSRARQPDAATPPATPNPPEPQLIKAPAAETPVGIANPASIIAPPVAVASAAPPSTSLPGAPARREDQPMRPEPAAVGHGDRRDEMRPREVNGFGNGAAGRDTHPPGIALRAAPPRPPGPQMSTGSGNSDPRRTLHLSLGAAPQSNGAAQPVEAQSTDRDNVASYNHQAQPQTVGELFAPSANRGPQYDRGAPDLDREPPIGSRSASVGAAAYPGPVSRGDGNGAARKEGGGSFIDHELRARVDGDIAAFLAAFDAALVQDTQESRLSLREATDRLLRAGARTRIELERLEARVPLPPRDNGGRGEPAWRQR